MMKSNWRLSRASYYLDFVVAPGFLLLALWRSGEFAIYTASGFAAGFLVWTLAEYLIHRFILHKRAPLKAEHARHHRLPEDYIGVPSWQTMLLFVALWALAWLALGERLGSATFAGILAGYFAYIVLHDIHHHHARSGVYRRYMGRLHDIHHARNRVNFGVSSPLWDLAFGTYEARA